jgi:hypothetical protein
MKRWIVLLVLMAGAAGLSISAGSRHSESEGNDHFAPPRILAFDTMYGVEGPLLGEANAIRGVVGDEAPWTIAHFIRGGLDTKGHLRILVKGLVFADDPSVPPDLVGKNDETAFRGLVSCLTEDGQGNIVTANVTSGPFPASVLGDSFIDASLDLPSPCVAPIVFVMAGSEDKWFAVTGFEAQSESSSRGRR